MGLEGDEGCSEDRTYDNVGLGSMEHTKGCSQRVQYSLPFRADEDTIKTPTNQLVQGWPRCIARNVALAAHRRRRRWTDDVTWVLHRSCDSLKSFISPGFTLFNCDGLDFLHLAAFTSSPRVFLQSVTSPSFQRYTYPLSGTHFWGPVRASFSALLFAFNLHSRSPTGVSHWLQSLTCARMRKSFPAL